MHRVRCLATLGLFLSLSVLGCDNSINAITDDAEGVFAIFGYLDTAADTQFVRIEGLRPSAFGEDKSLDGVTVTSRNQANDVRTWTASSFPLDGGGVGHVFFSVFRPAAGEQYTLDVTDPEGGATAATVFVPPLPELVTSAPAGDSLSLVQSIRVPGVTQTPRKLTMQYDVRDPVDADADAVRVVVDYGTGGERTSSGWEFEVFLTRDRATVMAVLQRRQTDKDVELVSLSVLAELLSPEWETEGTPENISSGLGFFGAIGRFSLEWELPTDFVSVLGYVDAQ